MGAGVPTPPTPPAGLEGGELRYTPESGSWMLKTPAGKYYTLKKGGTKWQSSVQNAQNMTRWTNAQVQQTVTAPTAPEGLRFVTTRRPWLYGVQPGYRQVLRVERPGMG